MGFCGGVVDGERRHVSDYVPESGTVMAEQFAEWVLMAEGLDPSSSKWRPSLIKVFVKHMGHNAVDASQLK